ncbi:vWA domain-containing protein [Candidatus Solirubrobacter pratensis]|uniref:vWA domain-containing protein n=1 Tax=Candidatus Solirubrobacter pratensis TaxID=1298857 RepID=UPI0003FF39DE|nr:VWA domain-containing protein [Candidatus Solirubrobacter pratensis]
MSGTAERAAAAHLHGFVDALCHAGLPVDPARRMTFLRAVADATPRDITRLFWTARVTLVSRVQDLAAFDAVFDAWFRGGEPPVAAVAPEDNSQTAAPEPSAEGELEAMRFSEGSGRDASHIDLRRRPAFRRTASDERRMLHALRRALESVLPTIDSRRRKASKRGQLDLRRTLRRATAGEVGSLAYRRRPPRARPVLLLIDVSGSLKAHSPDMLRFAHAVLATAPRGEAFTFGTHLTRVTKQLRHRDVDQALARLSERVLDADGGTRIGAALTQLLGDGRSLARARGAVIVVLSDGLERGDPTEMAQAVRRLSRLGHRLIWWTPLGRDPAYRPVTRAMAAILPELDHLAGAYDLQTLHQEVLTIPAICARPRRTVMPR